MSIQFEEISSTSRIGGVKVEFDSSRASGGVAQPHRVLLVCPKLGNGTLSTDRPKLLSGTAQADALCGARSIGAQMIRAAYAQSTKPEFWALGVADGESGAAATATIEVGGSPSQSGTIPLYVGGERVAVNVAAGDESTAVAAKIAEAINAEALPVFANSSGGDDKTPTNTVTLMCRHKGDLGNAIALSTATGVTDAMPAGLTLSITPFAGGAGEIDAGAVIALLGDLQFDTIVFPVASPGEADSLMSWATELQRRWDAEIDMAGVLFTAVPGDHASMLTLGGVLNSAHVVVVATGSSPTPPWVWAVATACADASEDDPARTRKTLQLVDVQASSAPFTQAEREQLIAAGIATTYGDTSGAVFIEALVTTYKRSATGDASLAYSAITTVRLCLAIRRAIQDRVRSRFARYKLGSDASVYGPGQRVVQPKSIRDTIAELCAEMESERGWIEDAALTAEQMVVERNSSDPDRVDVLLPLNLINNLKTVAVRVGFEL